MCVMNDCVHYTILNYHGFFFSLPFLSHLGPPTAATLSINQNPALINSVITLQCTVLNVTQVSPQPVYLWLLNDFPLSQYSTSSINITLTNTSQFGSYSCKAINSFSSVGATVNLQQACKYIPVSYYLTLAQ